MRFTSALLAAALLYAPAAMAQDFDLMEFADTDGDAKVTAEEYAAFREQGWGFFAQGGDKMKPSDAPPMAQGALQGVALDAEGFVTHAAYTAAGPDLFKKADKDNNGSLSSAELNATMRPAQ